MKLSLFRIPSLMLLGTFAAAAGSAVAADVPVEVPSVRVHFADLDLGKPAGTEALYGRLQRAARVVCDTYETRLLVQGFAWQACVKSALDRAVDQVGDERLTAYHLAHGSRSATAPTRLAAGAPAAPAPRLN